MAKTVHLDRLPPETTVSAPILSVEGVKLLEQGDTLDSAVVDALREFGFDPVVQADTESDADNYIRQNRYDQRPIEALKAEEAVGLAVYDNNDRLLVQAGQRVSQQQREFLLRTGVSHVYVSKPVDMDAEVRFGRFLLRLQQLRNRHSPNSQTLMEPPKLEIPKERLIADPKSITADNVDKQIETATAEEMEVKPEGPPLLANIRPVDPLTVRPLGRVRHMIQVHDSVVKNAEQIFAQIRLNKPLDGAVVGTLATAVVKGLINDPTLSLNLAGFTNSPYYIVGHSINTVLLSAHIGAQLGFSAPQIHELSYGALLHDVGMLRLPGILVNKKDSLTQEERLKLQSHPIIGLNILQEISRLPKTVPLVVYQENERLDGTGYPKGRRKALIHTYAKIVMVAASFDAMTSDRPHRRAMLPYYAVEMLLKYVNAKKFDSDVVRALLRALGLFPIGSWVKLNSGDLGRVVSATGDHYTRPVVSVVVDNAGKQLTEPRPVDLSNSKNSDLQIVQPVAAPRNLEGDMRTIGFTTQSKTNSTATA